MKATKSEARRLLIARESLVKEREQKIHEHEIRLEAGDEAGAKSLDDAINVLTAKINCIDEKIGV